MNRIIAVPNPKWRGGFRVLCALLTLAFLSACSSATVHTPYRIVDDLDSFLRYGAPDGEAQVDILGNPFGEPPERLAQALLEGFENGVNWGPHLRFSTRSASARPGYRFVIAFGAPANIWGDDLCRSAKTLRLDPKDRPIRVKAAFCLKDRAYSEATGSGGEIASLQDPEFRRWAWSLMRALTPPPEHRGMDNDLRP